MSNGYSVIAKFQLFCLSRNLVAEQSINSIATTSALRTRLVSLLSSNFLVFWVLLHCCVLYILPLVIMISLPSCWQSLMLCRVLFFPRRRIHQQMARFFVKDSLVSMTNQMGTTMTRMHYSGTVHQTGGPQLMLREKDLEAPGNLGPSWKETTKLYVCFLQQEKTFWHKTFYNPILIKDDAPVSYLKLDSWQWYTIQTSFAFHAVRQFDQAWLYIWINSNHWLKTGIEVVDQQPRLSVVVTNIYRDWSMQAWSDYTTNNDSNTTTVQCQLQIHCRGDNFVVETRKVDSEEWKFCPHRPH